ncbi:MAG: glycerol-3-phosphate acyltransferase [Acidimicrobiia bacterium]|nr:glycerol-3-phosphate acyltransferase [Acidimicrobiia bacterium]
MEPLLIFVAAILGYLLGSLSFARIIGRMVDPTADVTYIVEELPDGNTFESDSVSATAARMALGTRWGVTTGLLDMAKVGVPALIWVLLYPDTPAYGLISGIAGHLGHVFPLYHRFVGGRGESAVYGVVLLLDPLGALVTTAAGAVLGLVIGHILIFRWAGLVLLIPWMAWWHNDPAYVIYMVAANAIYWTSMTPELRQYVQLLKDGAPMSQEEIAGSFAMGEGLGRTMDRYGLLARWERRAERRAGE